MAELRIKLEGDEASLGQVAARDVAQLILAVEIAVMRAASVVLGRPKTASGRGQAVIEKAARFSLLGVEEGSVVPVLQLPEPAAADDPDALNMDVVSLAEMAVKQVLDTAHDGDGHPVVMGALLELADRVRLGDRYDRVTFDLRTPDAKKRVAHLDRRVTARLRKAIDEESVRVRDDTLAGTLVEADFEKHTARLRGQLNEAVTVSFDEDLADEIQDALRRQATFQGKVVYDPKTLAARSVSLTGITPGRQLILGIDPDAFWQERSFAELALAQGGVGAEHVDDIYDGDATEEEREAFMAALADLAE